VPDRNVLRDGRTLAFVAEVHQGELAIGAVKIVPEEWKGQMPWADNSDAVHATARMTHDSLHTAPPTPHLGRPDTWFGNRHPPGRETQTTQPSSPPREDWHGPRKLDRAGLLKRLVRLLYPLRWLKPRPPTGIRTLPQQRRPCRPPLRRLDATTPRPSR